MSHTQTNNVANVTNVTIGSRISAYFVDENAWYKGTVTKIHNVTDDKVVECDIEYDDGEFIEHATFHEDDFQNNESENKWKIAHDVYQSILDNMNEDILDMKNDIKYISQMLSEWESNNCASEIATGGGFCSFIKILILAAGILAFCIGYLSVGNDAVIV